MISPSSAPRILIVEDERIVARDLQQTLSELGYHISAVASSSEEALERAREQCPDLVLMDIRIKGQVDGIATAEMLRDRFGVPIVYLTAHADQATLDRAKRTEPLGYLMKPVQAAELRSTVELSLHRHDVEQRVREHERWLETTLRSIGDAVVCVDAEGRVMFVNAAAEALFEQSAAALGRLSIAALLPDVPDASNGVSERLVPRTGLGERVITETSSPVIDGGQVLGRVMVLRDVTDERRLARRLEMADRLASVGTMAAGVAHEINNPLVAVTANLAFVREKLDEIAAAPDAGAIELLRREIDALRDAIGDSQTAALRIARIVSDLRVFARPAEEQPQSADLASCIEWAIRTTSHELRQRARVVREVTALPAVRGDEARLGQVLVNLLINAAHAVPPGAADKNQIRIVGKVVAGRAVIEVHDTGRGIPPELRTRIFEPFFTTKPVGVGTGLGLFICHNIVESMGGEIEVESEVGRGSVFRMSFPVSSTQAATPAAETLDAPEPARGRVLIIDDEPLVLRVVTRILEREHQVTAIDSAHRALELMRSHDFDVILCDVTMPTMTGIELYEQLAATRPELAERMVFLSGGAVTARAEEFLRGTANRRLDKPVAIDRLMATVREVLAASSPR